MAPNQEQIDLDDADCRHILDVIPAAIYATDPAGRITFYNRTAVEMVGRVPDLRNDRWCVSWRMHRSDGTPLPHDECPMATALKEGKAVRGVEVIVERPDGTRAYVMPYPTPIFDRDGTLKGGVNFVLDISERRRAEREAAHLAAIVASSDDAILSKDLQGNITSWNEGASRIFGYDASEMIGQSIMKIIPEELRGEEVDIIAKVRKGERVTHYETQRVTKDNRRIDVSLTVSPVIDKSGKIIGASKVARDISSRKRAEEAQKLLVRELNHRVRNTLSVIQSVTHHTMRKAKSMADFAASFEGRIKAMAAAHTLLTESNWDGADIVGLIRSQLIALDDDSRIKLTGPSFHLTPQLTLHVGMLVHELATNSRKYGALSRAGGRLEVSWSTTTNGKRMLTLRWAEAVEFDLNPPSSRGFGSTLIQTVTQQSGGNAEVNFSSRGITWDISLDLNSPVDELPSDSSIRDGHATSTGEARVSDATSP
jgi:PAS domain S-box-containing protein